MRLRNAPEMGRGAAQFFRQGFQEQEALEEYGTGVNLDFEVHQTRQRAIGKQALVQQTTDGQLHHIGAEACGQCGGVVADIGRDAQFAEQALVAKIPKGFPVCLAIGPSEIGGLVHQKRVDFQISRGLPRARDHRINAVLQCDGFGNNAKAICVETGEHGIRRAVIGGGIQEPDTD